MASRTTHYAASGIANGHWEPTHRRASFLAVAREGIAKLLKTREEPQQPSEAPVPKKPRASQH